MRRSREFRSDDSATVMMQTEDGFVPFSPDMLRRDVRYSLRISSKGREFNLLSPEGISAFGVYEAIGKCRTGDEIYISEIEGASAQCH